jgi:3-dehydroquinate synthase
VRRVEVALGARSYDVTIGKDLLGKAAELLPGGRLLVVSDATVWDALGSRLALPGEPVLVPPGEASKSWAGLEALCEALIARGIERGDRVAAFGGGMVGDLAGFAAAIVKRGVGFVQIPTSLLAQVDSSVGGKTGINAGEAKNLVGAFHQPEAVLIDVAALDTLPARELRAGYAEVVKYGLIGDPAFFAWCEAEGGALLAGDRTARLHAIETSVRAKAAIVAADERETAGRRALLNLGHTFGHAIEAESGWSLLHGEAVAIGMALAFRFSAERGLCTQAEAKRVERHLADAGLPVRLPPSDPAALLARMRRDKKAEGRSLTLILARGIGAAFVARGVEEAEVAAFLEREAQPG